MLDAKTVMHVKLFFTTSVMSFQELIIGGVYGFSAVILPQLQLPNDFVHVDADQASWIASLPLLLCPVGSLVFGYLSDRFGRKLSLQLTYVPLLLSWAILANARCLNDIYIGRLLAGLATGTGSVINVYIAETSPAGSRQFYLSIYTLFVGLGLTAAAALGALMSWRAVAAAFGAMCAVGSVATFLVPSTPMWLRSRGRHEDARRAELWFGFEVPRADAQPVGQGGGGCAWSTYAGPTVWKPAAVAFAFFCCQEATGFYVLLFYSVDVLRDCRVPVDGMTAAVYLSAARLAGSVASLAFQAVPKRALTVASALAMCGSLSAVVVHVYAYADADAPSPVGRLLLVPFVAYVFFAMFAVLPLPWTVCGEMFPMAVKGVMNGALFSCGYELMFAAIKAYPWLVVTFGVRAVWAACAAGCLVTALFGAFVLPETAGKSLDEIVDGFASSSSRRKARDAAAGLQTPRPTV